MENPEVLIVEAEGDYAEDLYAILDLTSLPLPDQARGTATLIANPAKPHTLFLARYAVTLLANTGPESDTWELAQALGDSTDRAFSEQARLNLLEHGALYVSAMANDPSNNLLPVFCKLVAKYFLMEPEKPVRVITRAQSMVLVRCWRTLQLVKGGTAAFRSNVSPAVTAQLRAKLTQLIRDGLTDPELTGARNFLSFLESQ